MPLTITNFILIYNLIPLNGRYQLFHMKEVAFDKIRKFRQLEVLLFVNILHFLYLLGMLFLSLYGFFFKFLYALLQIFIPVFKLFQLTTTEKRTNLSYECGFRFRLDCFQFLRLDSFQYFVKLPFRPLLFYLLLLRIGFKHSRIPYRPINIKLL
ncbi:hypothetical protein B5G10_10445 [Barnesiella sp. An55]|nr:hypothetical protein B5G10_10445 [Barnesiella sp. An55]